MNAVFERDYVAFSSSARFLWMRTGFAVAMALLVFLNVFPSYISGQYQGVGADVLGVAVILGVSMLLLVTPGSFATVLVHARAQGTLPVILATPLTPLAIAAGAFVARIALLLVFILATWPPIALALVFGGVRGAQVFEASAAAVAAVLAVAAPAFLVSAFARRTASAVVTSYISAATILAVLWLGGRQLEVSHPWAASVISPIHALTGSISPAAAAGPSAGIVPGAYLLLLWTLAASAGSILAAALRLRQEGLGDGDPTVAGTEKPRRARALTHDNPVLDHELRRAAFTHRKSAGRGLLILLLLSEAAFFAGAYLGGVDPLSLPLHFGVVGFQCALLVLGVTAAGATTLAAEHESQVLDLMRVTPLTPAQIVTGKLLGLLRAMLPCLVVPLAHVLFASLVLGVFHPVAAPALVLVGSVAMATWALCGMTQSMEQGDPQRAVLRTMGLMGIFAVLTAAMIGVPVHGMFRSIDPWVRDGVGFGANPVAGMLLSVAVFRTGGTTVETTQVTALGAGDRAFALLGGGFWIVLHVVVALALYRRLFVAYRTRFDR